MYKITNTIFYIDAEDASDDGFAGTVIPWAAMLTCPLRRSGCAWEFATWAQRH